MPISEPKLTIKIVVKQDGTYSHTYHKTEIKSGTSLKVHRDFLIPSLSNHIHIELKSAIDKYGPDSVFMDLNDKTTNAYKYLYNSRELAIDIHKVIYELIKNRDDFYD